MDSTSALVTLAILALAISGLFTAALGTAHFFFPILLDFDKAIPRRGPPLHPFKLGPIHYATQRSDVYGIAWVMNHAASYTLVSIGVVDLGSWLWLGTTTGRILAVWIAVWWFLRAASQFYLGQRRGDWWIAAGFAWLGIVHGGVAFL
ncbi:MAG: hypothetical protein DYG89_40405 [Caldilinea sp. CFX5]|nr:hypothetical protein [Caldilinea sp. CFX5]